MSLHGLFLFISVRYKHKFYRKTVGFSRIQTRIVSVEGEHTWPPPRPYTLHCLIRVFWQGHQHMSFDFLKFQGCNSYYSTFIVISDISSTASVTKLWNKKELKCFLKLLKQCQWQLLFKGTVAWNSPKKSPNVWAIFARKFNAKNFQKSPNLVTLHLKWGSRNNSPVFSFLCLCSLFLMRISDCIR